MVNLIMYCANRNKILLFCIYFVGINQPPNKCNVSLKRNLNEHKQNASVIISKQSMKAFFYKYIPCIGETIAMLGTYYFWFNNDFLTFVIINM